MKKLFYKSFILTIIFSILSTYNALAIENDFQLWAPIYLTVPIKEKFVGYFEINPRLGDNVTDVNQLRLRPALGYKITDNLIFYTGYAWAPGFVPKHRNENRIWEQLELTSVFKKFQWLERFKFINQFRLEERLIEDAGSMGLRGRYMLQIERALDKNNLWTAVLYDKLYVNFYSVSKGPEGGFDQNRLYTGLRRKINDLLSIETGYQFQYIFGRGSLDNRINHAVVTSLYVNF